MSPVTGFGRPFGNWFPTYETYRDKLDKMSNYLFNLCPENSLHPDIIRKSVFTLKLPGVFLYIWLIHMFVKILIQTLLSIFAAIMTCLIYIIESLASFRINVFAVDILNAPLLHSSPNLDKLGFFLKYAISSIISQ